MIYSIEYNQIYSLTLTGAYFQIDDLCVMWILAKDELTFRLKIESSLEEYLSFWEDVYVEVQIGHSMEK